MAIGADPRMEINYKKGIEKGDGEFDPTGRGIGEPGAKRDGGKALAGLMRQFPHALHALVCVGTFGVCGAGYARGGWQEVPDGIQRYIDAEDRHFLNNAMYQVTHNGEEGIASDSHLPHEWHRLWNLMAVIELKSRAGHYKAAPENPIPTSICEDTEHASYDAQYNNAERTCTIFDNDCNRCPHYERCEIRHSINRVLRTRTGQDAVRSADTQKCVFYDSCFKAAINSLSGRIACSREEKNGHKPTYSFPRPACSTPVPTGD